MRPKLLTKALIHGLTIKRRHPMFIWGPPGVGKSSLVKQAAAKLNRQLCDVRAVLLDPVDLRGIPSVNGDHLAHWCPPAFLPRDGEGILFLDELAQAPPLVQSACLQLCLDRRCGEYVLPDGWDIIAASNRQEDRAGAHKIITPLLNRFASHLELELSSDDWQEWALTEGISSDVRSFLKWRPELLLKFDPTAGHKAFPSPRSWEFFSDLLDGMDPELLLPMAVGCIGEGAAAEFVGFLRFKNEMPNIDDVLANPTTIELPDADKPAVLWALTGALADRARNAPADVVARLVKVADRIPDEFAALFMRDIMAVNPAVCAHASVVGWVRSHASLFTPC